MNNTLVINESLKVRTGVFIQIPVPNVFDKYQTEEEILKFSSSFLELLKREYRIDDILLVRGTNSIKGDNIVACLMELRWLDRSAGEKLYKRNLLWFQDVHAFPINPIVELAIRKLNFDRYGIEDEMPF
jgi:hypothetical protein